MNEGRYWLEHGLDKVLIMCILLELGHNSVTKMMQ